MREAVGQEHFFSFGLDADAVAALHRSGRNPGWEVYEQDAEVRATLDFLLSSHFGQDLDAVDHVRHALLVRADPYMHLVDLQDSIRTQARVEALRRDPTAWDRSAVLNVARLGRSSSDRMAREYAERIWGITPARINLQKKEAVTRMMKRVDCVG